ncbi:MAG: hypothetical protein HOO91_02995 [Bacteroidales bacterium]|nr:hypothetical protein [Bacteroidales bacterium]
MKRIVLVLIAFCLSQIIYSQTNTFPATGNVGIGTTTPNSKIEVYEGNFRISKVAGVGGTFGQIEWYQMHGTGQGLAASIEAYRAPSNWKKSSIIFNTSDDINLVERMRINYDGNVGIGTTIPSTKLEATGTISSSIASANVVYFNGYINGTYPNRVTLGTSDWSGYASLWNSGSVKTVHFNSSGDSYFNGGNVGIGTTTPTQKLHISNIGGSSATSGTIQNGMIRLYEEGFGNVLDIGITSNNAGNSWIQAGFKFDLSVNKSLLLNPNGGNVGIGTTTPQNKLDVAGTIRCTEVKVVALPWSDFVFHPTYKLRTLGEVEQFIKANNHLPEIPTESEVKQNGVGLGEMNAKLLQKIEELTLYMIEQNKKIERVEAQNNLLMKEVEQLKAK